MYSKNGLIPVIGTLLFAMIMALMAGGGCEKHSAEPKRFTHEILKPLVGKSEEHVIRTLGKPASVELDSEGGRVLIYTKTGIPYTQTYDIVLRMHIDPAGKCFRYEFDD